MESDEESRSSSNSSPSSASSTNGPASPQPDNNESNDQTQEPPTNIAEETKDSETEKKDEEEELELSDVEDESEKQQKADISHEDLSDISDLESDSPSNNFTDLRQKLDKQRMNGSGNKNSEKVHDEDELDFEADEENPKKISSELKISEDKSEKEDGEENSDDGGVEEGEELEDGEVTDGDEKRPEESEPKAVCRFYTRGQCTWGMSCRFLHPGTTDKGNYTMFDMVRPIPVPQNAPMPVYDFRNERPNHFMPPHVAPHFAARVPPGPGPVIATAAAESESAWERGLRTAKEMIRKSNKRKEQDVDFDEKKMNLSGPQDETERDPYYAARGSPEVSPSFERVPRERARFLPTSEFSPPAKGFHRGAPAHYEEDAFGRVPRYRELPAHRMPHYEDDEDTKRRVRTNREVIVEKADEWTDPWERKRRGGSGGRERAGRGRERSYSNSSSYSSSSSSSRSRSSSESSGSPARRKQRFENHRSIERTRKPVRAGSRSASLKRRHSPTIRATTRTVERRASPSPPAKRKKPVSPPPALQERSRSLKKRRDSSSTSGSGSGSESESSDSSSTSSSKGRKRREKLVAERKPVNKAPETKKRLTPPREDKKDKEKASTAAKLKSTRREELLKQLKAVEDAIARKKSKI